MIKRKEKRIKPSTLRRKCLQLWSYIVRALAEFKCEFCGSTKFLQAHHIIGKRYKPTMFAIWNGICLCARCHKWGIGYSAHENPIVIAEFIKERRPNDYQKIKEEFHPKFLSTQRKAIERERLDFEKELDKLEGYRLEHMVNNQRFLYRQRRRIRRALSARRKEKESYFSR
jgi:hypothetical protein